MTERVRRALSAALSLPAECFDVDADLPVEPTAADAIEACFAAADANGSGTIEGKELPRVLATLGLSDKKKAVKEALAKYDDDGDKKLDLAEFTGLIEDIQKTDALISEQAALAAQFGAILRRNYSAQFFGAILRRAHRADALPLRTGGRRRHLRHRRRQGAPRRRPRNPQG